MAMSNGAVEGWVRGPFEAPHPFARLLASRIMAAPSQPPLSSAELAARHRALYERIPGFECEPSCTSCCGAIAMTGWEWAQVAEKRHATSSCLTCPYAAEGSCAIHADRPLICRLFGAVDHPRLTCPKGRGPTLKLSAEEAQRLMEAHQQLLADSAATQKASELEANPT
jgi:Fe-S-cluster containining protein